MNRLFLGTLLTLALNTAPVQAETLEERILEGAKSSQTVMFGENHNTSYEERYVAKLLPKLKKLGYTYFAVEADGKNESSCNYYKDILEFNKPVSQLVKTAESLEMKVIYYDHSEEIQSFLDVMNNDKMSRRERKAFANLTNVIFTRNPKAKVVVFCGFSHIAEQPSGNSANPYAYKIRWLGYFLEKYTRGKNLSVNLSAAYIPSADIDASNREHFNEIRNAK